jgi:hypothetical protein
MAEIGAARKNFISPNVMPFPASCRERAGWVEAPATPRAGLFHGAVMMGFTAFGGNVRWLECSSGLSRAVAAQVFLITCKGGTSYL